jgi:hypothetical protein
MMVSDGQIQFIETKLNKIMNPIFIRAFVSQILLTTVLGGLSALEGKVFAESLNFDIEPTVGLERIQVALSMPHQENRLFYGVGVRTGNSGFSIELQYVRGQNTSDFSDYQQTSSGDKLRLGFQFHQDPAYFFVPYLRMGAQVAFESIQQTVAGTSNTTSYSPAFSPYLGLGSRFRLDSWLYGYLEGATILPSMKDLSQIDYQASIGIGIHLAPTQSVESTFRPSDRTNLGY